MKKMIAQFEVEFDGDTMFDQYTIDSEFRGNWENGMKYLYNEEGLGIFDKDPELVNVYEVDNEN